MTNSKSTNATDILDQSWVNRFIPSPLRPYCRLARLDRPIGTWLLLLPCWWSLSLASPGWPSPFYILLFGIGALIMRGAGCTINDLADRDFDGKVARTATRPIVSGDVSIFQAFLFLGLQLGLGLLILLQFNTFTIWLGISSLWLIVLYPFMKRITYWPQACLGLAFNWGALLGWVAHHGSLEWPAVVLYLSGVAWTLFYDTIYAYQDTKDDALIGVKSTALLFGEYGSRWLSLFLGLSVVLMAVAIAMVLPISSSSFWIAIIGPALFGCHMARQLYILDTNDSKILLRLFRAMRNVGFWPVIFFIIVALL